MKTRLEKHLDELYLTYEISGDKEKELYDNHVSFVTEAWNWDKREYYKKYWEDLKNE